MTGIDEAAMAGGDEWGAWSGLTPEGAPLMLFDLRGKGVVARNSS